MKVLILAGGLGTRLSEETAAIPKPMVEIGGYPILWHIMKGYSHHGFRDFVVLLGYRGYQIKEYFANYWLHSCDVLVDLAGNRMEFLANRSDPWRITLIDTGQETLTGGRVRRAREYTGGEPFMLTYGDGVADVDVPALLANHRASGRAMTMTVVQPEGRFGHVRLADDGGVEGFNEKPRGDGTWVNGGFFVCEPRVFDFIPADDRCILEREPMERLAAAGELNAFRHGGFWRCMDTLRDKLHLQELWDGGRAQWKQW